ncbi:TetR/AcrR family transcriptional regulator [Gordonia sp. TBRC 11910]|uniref:TetR/AcrR family transcriptional regulator n=1 Tax=Gordonia asplenii TaxID=2725283 RepID=A0A848KPU9_9ACTN|nr:TetR/AcrR family transcriptional regulator [Gordonia asplenii]NMO00049.1 TetR/AcrR family transcriptional regulator [Gordonia asplenii]
MTDTVMMGDVASAEGDDLHLSPILSAALVELRENGYHGTSVRKIVTRAGLTLPSLYYHYGNKEGVLVALLNIAMDDLLNKLRKVLDDPSSKDPVVRLRWIVRSTVLHVTQRQDLASLHREFRFLERAAVAPYLERRHEVDDMLVEVLNDGNRTGQFHITDMEYTKLAVLGMAQGIADWYRPNGADSPSTIADRYEALTLRLVGADPTD